MSVEEGINYLLENAHIRVLYLNSQNNIRMPSTILLSILPSFPILSILIYTRLSVLHRSQ